MTDGLPQWFSSGTSFSEYAPGGHYKMFKEDKQENIIMVASEPLTFEKGESGSESQSYSPVSDPLSADWMEIKTNNVIVLTSKMNVLLTPIVDKFYVYPSDPDSQNRGTDLLLQRVSSLSDGRSISHEPLPQTRPLHNQSHRFDALRPVRMYSSVSFLDSPLVFLITQNIYSEIHLPW